MGSGPQRPANGTGIPAQALEFQAQAIDQWHQSFPSGNNGYWRRDATLLSSNGHPVPKELPTDPEIEHSPLSLEPMPNLGASRETIPAQPEIPNQETEPLTPLSMDSGSEWDQPAPSKAIVSAGWDEGDSWDFLATPRSESQDPPWEPIETLWNP